MTLLPEHILSGKASAPDILCGGTPCQAFSVAGLRKSLTDSRGNLSLTFCEIANAIDTIRLHSGKQPSIIFWENVPGVLNTKDNAFGCFLAGIAGESRPLLPSGRKWTNAGCVLGPKRTVAWRVIDAQYFGLAQRRKRVFVVASARNDFDPTAVLFESTGVRRDSAPSRKTREEVAGTIGARTSGGGGFGTDFECAGGLQPVTTRRMVDVYTCLPVYGIPGNWIGRAPENGGNATEPMNQIAPCLTKTDRHGVAVAFAQNQSGEVRIGEVMNTLSTTSSASGRNTPMVAFNWQSGGDARGLDPKPTAQLQRSQTPAVMQGMAVRRLMPVECERLQGFPDGYTDIQHKGKETPDGPRYKALGNSWAVPVIRWIGKRIQEQI